MSKLGIGINGFGRIGRMVLRASLHRNDLEIKAINDLLDVDHLVYLLKYDSVHGNVNADIQSGSDFISVNGNKITIFSEKDPAKIDWSSVGVTCLLYTSPSPRDATLSRMPSSA